MFSPYRSKNFDPNPGFAPRRTGGFLSTPQKKLILYLVTLVVIGLVIVASIRFTSGPGGDTVVVSKGIKRPSVKDLHDAADVEDIFVNPGENDDDFAELD